jgi:hypothetical protein
MTSELYPVLLHLHSGLRWILILSVIVTLAVSIYHVLKNNVLSDFGKSSARITMLVAHLQLLAGLVIYLISPKVVFSAQSMSSPILRFFLVEHISAMVVAILMITFGVIRAKRKPSAAAGTLLWTFIVALILILAMIPWPWSSLGGNWF